MCVSEGDEMVLVCANVVSLSCSGGRIKGKNSNLVVEILLLFRLLLYHANLSAEIFF